MYDSVSQCGVWPAITRLVPPKKVKAKQRQASCTWTRQVVMTNRPLHAGEGEYRYMAQQCDDTHGFCLTPGNGFVAPQPPL